MSGEENHSLHDPQHVLCLGSLFFIDYVVNFLDCKTVGFFLKISKETGKAWRKSLTRAKRASLTRPSVGSVSPQSRCLFSASFDCSRVLEYAKIRTVLRSINFRAQYTVIKSAL